MAASASVCPASGERRADGDGDLLQEQLHVIAARHHIEKARHLGTKQDRRHADATRDVGADHMIGARLLELRHRLLRIGPAHDREVRVQITARKTDEQVVCIGTQSGDEPARAIPSDAIAPTNMKLANTRPASLSGRTSP